MAASIDSLYKQATAVQARATCRQFGIQYLVANMYDQAWNDKQGWVWTLGPVVSDVEFRAWIAVSGRTRDSVDGVN